MIKNLFYLNLNNYDHKQSKCHIEFKQNLFKFFIDEIIKSTEKLNQKVIFITYNFHDSILNNNWRYPFVKNYFSTKKVIHLDTKEVLSKYVSQNNLEPIDLYSLDDFHLNELGNKIILTELNRLIRQHM